MAKNSTHSKIIELFKDSPKEFISGQAISEKLGISRNAVWKHIKGLRDEGFDFTTLTGKGYKLMSSPEPFNEEEILKQFKKHKIDSPLKFFQSVESTNIIAYDLCPYASWNIEQCRCQT